MTKLSEKAMLCRLNVSMWTARRHDKEASNDVAMTKGAALDAGRYNKLLVAKTALADIVTACGAARTFHLANTLPWMDNGMRILTAENYLPYVAKMREFRAAFDAEVNAFCDAYPVYVEDSRARLGDMFKAADYPSISEIRRSFGFDFCAMPLPDASDFRVTLNGEEQARIQADIESRVNAAIDGAMREAWGRVHEVVKHMADKLSQYRPKDKGDKDSKATGVFRDTLVSNVRELAELLPRLNITGDATMDATARRMIDQLCAYDVEALRDDPALRQSVADEANAILAAMGGYVGDFQPMAA